MNVCFCPFEKLRYALRRVFQAPGFSLLVIATIAFAVGVNVGVFSVVQSVLLRAIGVPEADRVVHYTFGPGANGIPFSGPAYEALRASDGLGDLALWNYVDLVLQSPEGATKVPGALVNPEFFSVMKLRPALGRFFDEPEDQPGGGTGGWEAALSYGYWKDHYNLDPRVIGKWIAVNGSSVHITGVLPQEFNGLNFPIRTEVLLPRHFFSVTSPGEDHFALPGDMEWDVYGRLSPQDTLAELEAKLHVIEPAVRKAADPTGAIFPTLFPTQYTGPLLSVHGGELGNSYVRSTIRTPLLAVQGLGAVLFVLCVCNLILLFAGRTARQFHDAAIRTALGATRKQLISIPALEAAILSLAGSLAAVPIGWWMARALSMLVHSTPGFETFPAVTPGIALLLPGSGLGTATAILVASGVTLWQSGKHPVTSLGKSTVGTTGRFTAWVLGLEVFAAVLFTAVTVVGAVGISELLSRPSGFAADKVVTATLGLIDAGQTPRQVTTRMDRLLNAIAEAPGVTSVATVNAMPLSGFNAMETFAVRDRNGAIRVQSGIWPMEVSLHYFDAAGTRILKGRNFALGDVAGGPVCLVSQHAARSLFGSAEPLKGLIFAGSGIGGADAAKPYCRVIGTVENAHLKSMLDPPNDAIYRLTNRVTPNILVHAASSRLAILAVRNAVHAIAPMSLTSRIDSLQIQIQEDLRVTRLLTLFAGLCACFTSLVMAIGVFGVHTIEIAARTRDIGIQISLGAGRWTVCKAVIKRFTRPTAAGLLAGLVLALVVVAQITRKYSLRGSMGIESCAVGLLLTLVMICFALAVPVLRALSIAPMDCLRSE